MVALPDTPGPSPWYLKAGDGFTTARGVYRWKHDDGPAGSGMVKLLAPDEHAVLLLNFQSYVKWIGDGRLLIWSEDRSRLIHGAGGRIEFRMLDLDSLERIANVVVAAARMRDEDLAIGMEGNSGQIAAFTLDPLPPGRHRITPPDPFGGLDEVLILADYHDAGGMSDHWEHMVRAIYVLQFGSSLVEVHPQDWFNSADLDFGYQWITRVWRLPDGRIAGDGIRINSFVLDPTFRELEK